MRRGLKHVGAPMYLTMHFISIIVASMALMGATAKYAQFLELGNVNTRIVGYIAFFKAPLSNCFVQCELVDSCFFISYHDNQNLCFIHRINKTAKHQTGWKIHYKTLNEQGKTHMDLMNGANASQSMTHSWGGISYSADLALDGNTANALADLTCSHTDDSSILSYWIMQFGMAGVVAKVDMYLRSDYAERNSNRAVLVALNYEDAVEDVGMECGSYFGPLIDQPPYLLAIHCQTLLYGSFLRITRLSETNPMMELCEVIVYTP